MQHMDLFQVLLKYSQETGEAIASLKEDFEAEGVDVLRMLETTGRLQAAVKSSETDLGKTCHGSALTSHACMRGSFRGLLYTEYAIVALLITCLDNII